jgi:hypothetical protein
MIPTKPVMSAYLTPRVSQRANATREVADSKRKSPRFVLPGARQSVSPEGHPGGDTLFLPPRVTFRIFVRLLMGFRLTAVGSLLEHDEFNDHERDPASAVSDRAGAFDQTLSITFHAKGRARLRVATSFR